ncbi:MAG TPA: hypothetical protein VKF40_17615 [Burkholderiales bacterium]|nr:hypothetical protein [Burkholderiales bacterium]
MMLIFREEQLRAFQSASQANFCRRLLRNVCEEFPDRLKIFGEPAISAMVSLGLDRAKARGLESEEAVMRHLGMMILFGSYWESDPQLPWVKQFLGPADAATAERMTQLWEQAKVVRQRIMGPDDGLYLAALRSIEGKTVEDLTKFASRSHRDLLIQIAAMYPRKFTEAGEAAFANCTRLAVEACRPFDLMDRWSVVLMVEFMLLFGAGFLNDPLYAWATEALKDPQCEGVDQKLDRLLKAAQDKVISRTVGSRAS